MRRTLILLTCTLLVSRVHALQPGKNDVLVRVVDTRQALCCVVKMPDDRYMIYDAGHSYAINKINELIELQKEIGLLVLSHTDRDHIGAVDEICRDYKVKEVLRSGYTRNTEPWRIADGAIVNEENCKDIKLSEIRRLHPGSSGTWMWR